jgi:hypothetical protein
MPDIKVGDVVYAEGSSKLLGDVVAVDEEGVEVCWRKCYSTEQPEDLVIHAAATDRPEPPEHLADAWRRFQEGGEVSQWELRHLDEWRMDVAWDETWG